MKLNISSIAWGQHGQKLIEQARPEVQGMWEDFTQKHFGEKEDFAQKHFGENKYLSLISLIIRYFPCLCSKIQKKNMEQRVFKRKIYDKILK